MEIPYELIAKYIKNECSRDDVRKIEEWINVSVKNKQTFDDLKSEWKHLNDSSPEIIPDKEKIWNLITQRLESNFKVHNNSYFKRSRIPIAVRLRGYRH